MQEGKRREAVRQNKEKEAWEIGGVMERTVINRVSRRPPKEDEK